MDIQHETEDESPDSMPLAGGELRHSAADNLQQFALPSPISAASSVGLAKTGDADSKRQGTPNEDDRRVLKNAKKQKPSPDSPNIPTTDPYFLLVDDNPINLRMLKTYMIKQKRPYVLATNGQEAVDEYAKAHAECSCILMDISMPIMDGLEATRRIRAFEKSHKFQPATIIALTGLASDEAQQEAFASGIDLFLTKPVKLKELGSILSSRKLLSQRSF